LSIFQNYFNVGNFTGKVTDLNVWNIPISREDIEAYALQCNQRFLEERKVIDWEKIKDFTKGNRTRIVKISDNCSLDQGKQN
jgi:hypothetical protein